MSLDSLDPSGIWELNGRSDQWLSRLGPFAPAVEQLILLLQKAGPLDAGDPPNITTREYDLPTAILGPLTIVPEGYCTYHGADDDEAFAHLVGKACFTVREWARLGRIKGQKRGSGRGAHAAWVFSHEELQRYQRDGLLPLRSGT